MWTKYVYQLIQADMVQNALSYTTNARVCWYIKIGCALDNTCAQW